MLDKPNLKLVLSVEDVILLANMDDFIATKRALEALAVGLDVLGRPNRFQILTSFQQSVPGLTQDDNARFEEVLTHAMGRY